MDIKGEYTFDAPRELVWKSLQDPNVLAKVMPGGEEFSEVGEDEYQGILNIKVGPVRGKFQGNIKITDKVEPESYNMVVDGKGAPGFVKATGAIKLDAQGDKTLLDYSGSARIGGRIASVGQRLLDSSAKSIIRQSLTGLNDYLKLKAEKLAEINAAGGGDTAVVPAAQDTGASASESDADTASAESESESAAAAKDKSVDIDDIEVDYKPPSQAKIAMTVAKDVASDVIPAPVRILFLLGVGIGIGFLLCRLL